MKYFTLDLKDRLEHKSTHHRLGAFCDGVFAIAITLLIIEIHPPHLNEGSSQSLTSSLLEKWPQYFSYALSFITIGTYWINHHFVFNLIKYTNHVFTLLTMTLLMTLTFIPFPTAVLGEYFMNETYRDSAVRFYILCLTTPAVVWWLSWTYAVKSNLTPSNISVEYLNCMNNKFRVSVLLFASLVLLTFVSSLAALVGTCLITISYLIPIPVPQFKE